MEKKEAKQLSFNIGTPLYIPKDEIDVSELDIEEIKAVEKNPVKNELNDLSGKEWLFFTKSLITTAYPSEYGHELRKEHGANKPPQLMAHLIRFFTKSGQRVLDPFAGVGGTLIGASITRRQALGIEINPKWVDIYKQVCEEENIEKQQILIGDCREVLKQLEHESFDFICTDPPYNLNFERTMCDSTKSSKSAQHRYRRTDYEAFSDMKGDLSNLEDYPSFLEAIEHVNSLLYPLLKPGKYMAMIVRNAYQNSRYIMTHSDIARDAEDCGFILKGEIIWYQAGSRLRPYGYSNAYVPNIVHQYILIFRKPKDRNQE